MTMRATMWALVAAACATASPSAAQTEKPTPARTPTPAPAAKPAPAPVNLDTSPIVAEGMVNAPPAEVWRVFTTGEGFKSLGPAKADVDLRVGGLIRAHYKPDGVLGDAGTIQNRILAFEPQRMLTIQIDSPPAGFPFMDVYKNMWTVITLTDAGADGGLGRTHLRIAAMGFGPEEQSLKMRDFFRTGNDWTLKTLQSKFDASVKPKDITMAHTDDPPAPASPTAPIDISRDVKAPRDAVYKAYTTNEGWKAFFEVETNIEARPGGPFEIYFGPADQAAPGERGSEGCTVLSLIPNEMFSYTWNAPPKLPFARTKRSWVVITFQELSPGTTRVRVRHLGFDELAGQHPAHAAEFAETREYFAKAWPYVLGALAAQYEPDVNK